MIRTVLRRGLWIVVALLLVACSVPDDPIALPQRDARLTPVLAETRFGATVAEAVRGNPVLASSDAEIAAAQAALMGERSAGRPSLQLGLDLVTSAVFGAVLGGRSSPVAQVSQLLFDGGALQRRIEAAEIDVRRQAYLRDAATSQVALNAVQAWVDLQRSRALRDLAAGNVRAHREVLQQVEDLAASGLGTQVDSLTTQSRLAQAKAGMASAENALARAQATYIQFFRASPSGSLAVPPAPALPRLAEAELIATSPRLRTLDAEIASAQSLLAASEAARSPVISLEGGVGYDAGAGGVQLSAAVRPRFDVMTGGRRTAEIARMAANVASLRADRELLARDIQRTLAVLRADQVSGRAAVVARRAAVRANTAAVEAVREQIATGRQSVSQLLDAQRDRFESEQALVEAKATLALTGYAALALTGDILDVFGLTPVRQKAEGADVEKAAAE